MTTITRPADPAISAARAARAPRLIGSTIGLVGGTVFVLANRGALPGPWATVALVAWAAALAVAVWTVFRLPSATAPARPRRGAGLVYLGSCVGMIALINGGSLFLASADRTALVPALVALAVGLHFLPFAWAFHTAVFRRLGWALATIATAGLVLGAAVSPAAAVLAGLTMIVMIATDAYATSDRR